MQVIEVKNLVKKYEYYNKETGLKSSIKGLFHREKLLKEAVKGISFNIEQGEIVGFLGPNGAGKTTTIKMLSGILFPTHGQASVLGYIPWERKKEFKRQFSILMGQKNKLWWDLPANESFYLNKCIYEIDDKEYNKTLDELTELLDAKKLLKVQVRRLSLGERMKMELIASLLHKPKVIYLDEPTIGLDIISQKKVHEFLKYYNKQEKVTILLTSHYINDIESLCKRTIVINEGNLVFDGDLKKVNDIFGDKKLIKLKFEKYVDENNLKSFGIVKSFTGFDAILEVGKDNVKEISKILLDKLPVFDFNIEDIPIENGIELLYKSGGE